MKKKILALSLAIITCFSLCACGGEEIEKFKVGEVASTSKAEFTLTRFEIGEVLDNSTSYDEYMVVIENPTNADKQSGQYANPFVAESGKCLISITFTIKNIGKETLDWVGDSRYVADMLKINYNNGYEFEFEDDDCALYTDGSWERNGVLLDIEPLSNACEYRAYVEVSSEVMTDTSNSLVLQVKLPTDKRSQTIEYVIR